MLTPRQVASLMNAGEVKQQAREFLVEHFQKVTVVDALEFLGRVRRVDIPIVIATWREHGLTATLLLEIAVKLINEHREPRP